jgi:hypothetical protein
MIRLVKLKKAGYTVQNITYEEGGVESVVTYVPLVQCNMKFFEDYNDYLDFGATPVLKSKIETFPDNSYCLPDYLEADIQSDGSTKYSLTVVFGNDYVKSLQAKGGNKVIFATFNYQHLIVTVDPTYFDEYFKKVWAFKTYYLNSKQRDAYIISIKKTELVRFRKRFIFPIKDSEEVYTVDDFENWFTIENVGDKEDFALLLMLEMDEYNSKIQMNYVSLDDIIGGYGGTSEVFFKFSEMIVEFLVLPFFTSSVINEVFKFHENKLDNEKINEFVKTFHNAFTEKEKMKHGQKLLGKIFI